MTAFITLRAVALLAVEVTEAPQSISVDIL
jgi:hypothetical protein